MDKLLAYKCWFDTLSFLRMFLGLPGYAVEKGGEGGVKSVAGVA